MPQLKQLSCCIQWSNTGVPFREHGTVYGDGVVETFIVVPNKPQGFNIRLNSRGFIYEGLLAIVFMDGNYQCNRSRVNLRPPKKDLPLNRTEVDFVFRQKEKPQGDGFYLGREWRFDNHNIVIEPPAGSHESHFDDLGTIEILILRCRARNRQEADYEGSSSGEDSDVFGEQIRVHEADSTTNTSQPASAIAPVPAPSDGEQPIGEDTGMGLFGLFDGTNDQLTPSNYDGGYDGGYGGPSGRWIWHQSRAPFVGLQDPPEYHQPEGQHFGSGSYAYPPVFLNPQAPADLRKSPSTLQHLKEAQAPLYSQLHRPPSRLRERRPTNGVSHRPSDSYGPQRIPPPSQNSAWAKTHDDQSHRRLSTFQKHDKPPPTWGYGNGSGHNKEGELGHHASPVCHNPSRPREGGQQRADIQYGGNRPSSPARRVSHSPALNLRSRIPLQSSTQYDQPRQNSWNSSGQDPIREKAPDERYRPSGNGRMARAWPPEHHPQYQRYDYTWPHHQLPMFQPPPHVYWPYPYSTPMPHAHSYHHGYHPGCWPTPDPYPHGAGDFDAPEGRRTSITLHPPHEYHPDMEEQVSPTNITCSLPYEVHTSRLHNAPDQGLDGRSSSPDASGNENAVQQGSINGPSGDGHNGSWGDPENGLEQGHAENYENNWDESGNDNFNQNNAEGDPNNGPQGEAYNQNDNGWDNNANHADENTNAWNDGGANGNGWENQGHDASGPNNNNNWNESGAVEGGAPMENSQSTAAKSDILRDLYGPHGPYYALRAVRAANPSPQAEEEPRFDVPKLLAAEKGSTKQVQPGPGYRYFKKRSAPEYVDNLESPYARFVFKYRTKDQLLNETGIEVDVEPTSDSEIQDLQNLEKQALIEMLIRAKGALGGKVPSPPPTPLSSTQGSDAEAPIIINAPKQSYLKYSLPALRPNSANIGKNSPAGGQENPKTYETGPSKENNTGWDNSGNNTNSNQNNWDGGGDWGDKEDPRAATSSQPQNPPQSNGPGVSYRRPGFNGFVKEQGPPPRPLTPPGVPPQQTNIDSNWNEAGQQSGNSGGKAADITW